MEKLTFFAKSGLTLTSANHIANLAKEYARSDSRFLESVSFINTGLTIIGSDNVQSVHKGWDSTSLVNTSARLLGIAEANSLIAWLREAIKTHESYMKIREAYSLEDYCAEQGIEIPQPPVREPGITKDQYIESMSIKERNKMLMLQAKASVFGKYIHPDGPFANARKVLHEKLSNETEVKGNGRDTLLYHHIPTVDAKEVEEIFYELQQEYRSIQAELNGYLHKIDMAVQLDNDEKALVYSEEMARYRAKMADLNSHFEVVKLARLEATRNLRIVIPNELQGVYSIVSSLGKQ